MTPAITHLPAADRVGVPWRNGGGVTETIATYPAAAAEWEWEWRISTATVARAGRFSVFEGVDRTLLLLSGALRLSLAGCPDRLLRAGEACRFAGDIQACGTPIDGPATDLNIMVRRGCWQADLLTLVDRSNRLTPRGGPVVLLAENAVRLRLADRDYDLATGDAILIGGDHRAPVEIESEGPLRAIMLTRVSRVPDRPPAR